MEQQNEKFYGIMFASGNIPEIPVVQKELRKRSINYQTLEDNYIAIVYFSEEDLHKIEMNKHGFHYIPIKDDEDYKVIFRIYQEDIDHFRDQATVS